MNIIRRRVLCIITIFTLLFWLGDMAWSSQQGPCTGKNATLDCLKQNINELYQADHDRFWDIIYIAEKKAFKGKDIKDTVSFLGLVEKVSNIAEYEEYKDEIIPTLCVKNPRVFLDALSASRDETIKGVMLILKNQIDVEVEESNLYIDNALVSKVLSKYKKEKKYKKIMKMYFKK